MRKIYGDGDPTLPWSAMSALILYWSTGLGKLKQKYNKSSLQFQHKQICKDYKDAKTMDDVDTKYHVNCSCWLSFGVAIDEDLLKLQNVWSFGISIIDKWGGHMLLVRTYSILGFTRSCSFLAYCCL